MNKKGFIIKLSILLVLILILVLVWGFIGGQEAQSIGITCDTGYGDSLCWKWHKNVIGEVGDVVKGLIG